MKNIDRVVLISDALGEAVEGHVSQLDLLALADVVVTSDLVGGPEEYDRPLNGSNPNFFSLPVDFAVSHRGFALASKEAGCLEERNSVGVNCPQDRFANFCKQIAA